MEKLARTAIVHEKVSRRLPAPPAAACDSAPAALCPAPRRAAVGPSAAPAAGTACADVLARPPAAGIRPCTAAGGSDTDPSVPPRTPTRSTSPAADMIK